MNNINIETIKETVKQYKNIIETLSPFVKEYFDINSCEWEHFSGWNFIENGTKVSITYSYDEIENNIETYTEFDEMIVPLEDILFLHNK